MIHQAKQFTCLLTSTSILIASFSCNAFQPSDVNGKEFHMGDKVLSISIEGPTYQSLKEFTDAGLSLASLGISPGNYYSLTLKHTSKSLPGVEVASSMFCTFSSADSNNLNCTSGLGITYNPENHSVTETGSSSAYYEVGYEPK